MSGAVLVDAATIPIEKAKGFRVTMTCIKVCQGVPCMSHRVGYTCVCTHTHTYTYTNIHSYIHTYIYIYTHTDIYKYAQTYAADMHAVYTHNVHMYTTVS
jgi:hypothetical protein